MNTDRRIYFTTAIVALVVMLAISLLAQSDPLSGALRAPARADSPATMMQETQSKSPEAVQAIGVRAPSSSLDFAPAPSLPDAVRLARANPAL